jgi:hypothetical protein
MGGNWVDWLVIAATGIIAWHGLTYRDAVGNRPWVYLLFGIIALVVLLRTLLDDVLDVW